MDNLSKNLDKWRVTVGLEIHAQVVSKSKLFSSSDCTYASKPNVNVSLFDAALPGTLPSLNKFCLLQAIKTGLAFSGEVQNYSRFDRKNYFYPDLPSGYQITQFYHPIVKGGHIKIKSSDTKKEKTIGLDHIHLEQDAGKSVHVGNNTYIDLNRAGVPLMEIVSKPDINSAEEAIEYVKNVRKILRYIGSCDANMEKGELRCDANVSVNHIGDNELGTRCEIKNLNSLKSIYRAINFEVGRQINFIENGGKISSMTMLFDVDTGETKPMRAKEVSNDYRYFSEPDLLPIYIEEQLIKNVKLPELPDEKFKRYTDSLGISEYYAEILTSDRSVAEYFEEMIKSCSIKKSVNWIVGELFSYLKKHDIDISNSIIKPNVLSEIVILTENNILSESNAKKVFSLIVDGNNSTPIEIVEELGLKQISDRQILLDMLQEVINDNKSKVIDYKNGKKRLLGFFIGQVMKKTCGNANPVILDEIAKELLNK